MMLEFLVWDCQPTGAHYALEVGTKILRFASLLYTHIHIYIYIFGVFIRQTDRRTPLTVMYALMWADLGIRRNQETDQLS